MNIFTQKKLFYPMILTSAFMVPAYYAGAQCFDYSLKYSRPQQQFVTMPPNIVSSLSSDFTIETYFYPTASLSFLQSESLFTAGNSTSDFMTLALFSGNNSPVFTLDVNGDEDDIITSTKVSLNTWHDIAVVSSGGVATLYLDGKAIGSTTLDNAPSALGGGMGTSNDWLGQSEFSSDPYFSGYMDEFRISNDARYLANYTPPGSPFSPDANTDVLYHFDDASGQIVSDSSGNGNNAVLGATAAVESTDPTWQNCAALPIFLTDFTAELENSNVNLQWTAFKNDNYPGSFTIERSADGITFNSIGTVQADNQEGAFNYNFTDTKPLTGNNFYRLLMIDLGSADNYSGILYIANTTTLRFMVFPTIASAALNIQLQAPATLAIIDAAGATLKEFHLTQSQAIDVSGYAKGFYFVVNKETGQIARFIKN
jgi:hypothetical protein